MSFDPDSEDRWSDDSPSCPYCGKRIKTTATNRACASCERGVVIRERETRAKHPGVPDGEAPYYTPYQPLRLTPDQILSYRTQEAALERFLGGKKVVETGEVVPEPEIEEAEREVLFRK